MSKSVFTAICVDMTVCVLVCESDSDMDSSLMCLKEIK